LALRLRPWRSGAARAEPHGTPHPRETKSGLRTAACGTASGSESGPDSTAGLGFSFATVVPRRSPLATLRVAIGLREMTSRANPCLGRNGTRSLGRQSGGTAKVIGDDLGYAAGHASAGRNVQEFVGAVGVRAWTQDAGDKKLRLREAFAEHRHKWNGSAQSHVRGGFTKVSARRLIH